MKFAPLILGLFASFILASTVPASDDEGSYNDDDDSTSSNGYPEDNGMGYENPSQSQYGSKRYRRRGMGSKRIIFVQEQFQPLSIMPLSDQRKCLQAYLRKLAKGGQGKGRSYRKRGQRQRHGGKGGTQPGGSMGNRSSRNPNATQQPSQRFDSDSFY